MSTAYENLEKASAASDKAIKGNQGPEEEVWRRRTDRSRESDYWSYHQSSQLWGIRLTSTEIKAALEGVLVATSKTTFSPRMKRCSGACCTQSSSLSQHARASQRVFAHLHIHRQNHLQRLRYSEAVPRICGIECASGTASHYLYWVSISCMMGVGHFTLSFAEQPLSCSSCWWLSSIFTQVVMRLESRADCQLCISVYIERQLPFNRSGNLSDWTAITACWPWAQGRHGRNSLC